ncbi:acetylornithine deacetylase/succinyl-diaminopimelate desuccinylase-like protein [Methylohalomonas lacus]|uniref:Acetylornithine deacetylase/succinyl-diaminopimelate desuccinylase-like protein n=1 Tax=Methylohalomonas lacus TaxID=398773 RepID=A0AAE3L1Q0_9GAMM|nr:M20 family metallopeptidase [Methylohalomonas lacus]MCS3903431.1 acetylornithine deacetylase/succinyl-diaminopimelate desuccinylase-like protein [Methylohalomonas lacus]
MDTTALKQAIEQRWQDSVLPELVQYIKVPNKSPLFDPDWAEHGYMDTAVEQFADWCGREGPADMQLEIVRLAGRTPLLYIEIPASGDSDETVLLYGHLDKQPEMTGWRAGLGPWQPVIEGDRLYGRGGADDGYATFASLLAVRMLAEQDLPHARCVILIEASEESGSPDLPAYIDHLSARIGTPALVICLDSGCGNYDQLWCTTSLRGLVGGDLCVEVLDEGVHSGDASGIVPSSFRLTRQLLERIEDAGDGRIRVDACHVDIPATRRQQAERAAAVLGNSCYERFPFASDTQPNSIEPAELILNRTWRPALEITGAAGLPPLADAGNVLRPATTLKLSLRLPPTCDAAAAAAALKQALESAPPQGCRVHFNPEWCAGGWHAPLLPDWLDQALDQASQQHFGKPVMHMGEGGSIPFMGMLGEKFPQAQFLVTGVLGPQSNAHGPNEFLHLPTAMKLTACVAEILAAHDQAGARA